MKVILLNGSPHEKGCTYTALKECGKALEDNGVYTEVISIGIGAIHGCIACFECEKNRKCKFNDDICNNVISAMEEADGIIVGSPVYFAGPTGAICSILERIFTANPKALKGKPAAAIASCRRSGGTTTFDRLNKFFAYNHMPIVTSQNCWNTVHGCTPEDVIQDEEGLQTMRVLGKNMAWLIKSNIESTIPMPEDEEYVETSFIR